MTWRVAFRGVRATFYFAFFATLCTGFTLVGVWGLLKGQPRPLLAMLLPTLGLGVLLLKSYRSMIAIWRRDSDELNL